MRIATWNVNSITARLPRLLAWLESSGTDVLCLQEAKVAEEQFPSGELRELGYEAAVHATGRWNGVAVLSRVGIEDVVKGLPGDPASTEWWSPARSPRPAARSASGRSTCRTAARWTTRTTRTSSSGSRP